MKMLKLIISLVLVAAVLTASAFLPLSASASEPGTSFWDWGQYFLPPLGLKKAYDAVKDKVNPDCDHSWVRTGSGLGSSGNTVAYYHCSVCGENMTVDGPTAGAAYNQYVNELPATGYDSGGGLLLTAEHNYIRYGVYGSAAYRYFCCPHCSLSHNHFSNGPVPSYNCAASSGSFVPIVGDYKFSFSSLIFSFTLDCPYDGYYALTSGTDLSYSFFLYGSSGLRSSVIQLSLPTSGLGNYYSADFSASYSYSFSISKLCEDFSDIPSTSVLDLSYLSFALSPPVFRFTPVPGVSTDFDATYNTNTRVTNITGDVSYYDIDGTLQLAPNVNIVNEGNKTYYNPVTNTTNTVNNWTYDYSDRSYTLELNTGDTVNVTYGDEYIRIEEDNRVYNVYYVTNNTTLPETHTHEWYQTGAAQATCTEYGTKTYTCYTCNEQKTEVLPALGHAWVQSGRVDAVVDEEGNETDPAHILYICSRCGEEYKDYDGAGPPAPPEDPEDDGSGILAWLKEFKIWLGGKLDKLTGGDTVIDNDYSMTYVDEDGEEQEVKVKDIADKFGWWKQVVDIGETFVSQVAASEAAAYAYSADGARAGPSGAPSIPLDLSLAQSHYGADYGGEIEMLDLSWYTPYKKTVDDLVSGFLWLFFLWALFKRVPAIIAGEGLIESRMSELRSSGSGPSSGPDVPLLPSKRKGG